LAVGSLLFRGARGEDGSLEAPSLKVAPSLSSARTTMMERDNVTESKGFISIALQSDQQSTRFCRYFPRGSMFPLVRRNANASIEIVRLSLNVSDGARIGVIIIDDGIQSRRYRATFLRIFQHIAAQKGSVRNDTLSRQGRASRGAARSLIALSGNNSCFAWLRSTLIAPSSRQVCLTRRGSFERAHLYRNSRPNGLLQGVFAHLLSLPLSVSLSLFPSLWFSSFLDSVSETRWTSRGCALDSLIILAEIDFLFVILDLCGKAQS